MKRLLILLPLVAILAACGSSSYAGDSEGEARDVAAAAIANQCPSSLAKTLSIVPGGKVFYAGHEAWQFVFGRVIAYAWYSNEQHRDYSIVIGCQS